MTSFDPTQLLEQPVEKLQEFLSAYGLLHAGVCDRFVLVDAISRVRLHDGTMPAWTVRYYREHGVHAKQAQVIALRNENALGTSARSGRGISPLPHRPPTPPLGYRHQRRSTWAAETHAPPASPPDAFAPPYTWDRPPPPTSPSWSAGSGRSPVSPVSHSSPSSPTSPISPTSPFEQRQSVTLDQLLHAARSAYENDTRASIGLARRMRKLIKPDNRPQYTSFSRRVSTIDPFEAERLQRVREREDSRRLAQTRAQELRQWAEDVSSQGQSGHSRNRRSTQQDELERIRQQELEDLRRAEMASLETYQSEASGPHFGYSMDTSIPDTNISNNTPVPTASRASAAEPSNPGGENSGGQCIVCQDDEANMVILDCGHLALCNGCADMIMQSTRKCPLCRINITKKERLLRVYRT